MYNGRGGERVEHIRREFESLGSGLRIFAQGLGEILEAGVEHPYLAFATLTVSAALLVDSCVPAPSPRIQSVQPVPLHQIQSERVARLYAPRAVSKREILARPEGQTNLSLIARQYLADNPETLKQVVARLSVPTSDGSNICGPLTAQILKDAGLVSADFNIHDFFKLDIYDSMERRELEQYLPPDRFTLYQTDQSIRAYDFRANPLQAKDVLFLQAGTYSHWLIVTRVDPDGSVWSVTNVRVQPIGSNGGIYDNFRIEEVKLYDPNRPEDSEFWHWTDRNMRHSYGNTGNLGFWRWRPK